MESLPFLPFLSLTGHCFGGGKEKGKEKGEFTNIPMECISTNLAAYTATICIIMVFWKRKSFLFGNW